MIDTEKEMEADILKRILNHLEIGEDQWTKSDEFYTNDKNRNAVVISKQ